MTQIPVALQMYTVREDAARDFVGTVEQVAQIGYVGVELAGYGSLSAASLHELLTRLGVVVAGSHVALARLESELGTVITECQTLNCTQIVCPVLPMERRNEAGFRALAVSLNEIGRTVNGEGLTLCYHNHAFEFETTIDGAFAYDWLLANTDPSLVQFEIDAYWMQKAGQSPAAYMERYAWRVPLVHLKDMTTDERQTFAPVGTGSVDFAPIFAAAERGGAKWYIVEQDRADGSAIEVARTSWNNLRAMGKM